MVLANEVPPLFLQFSLFKSAALCYHKPGWMVFSKPMGQTDPGGRNYTGEYKNIFIFLIRPKTRPTLLSEEERDEKGYHFTEKSLKVIEKARKGTLPAHDAVVRHSTCTARGT